MTSTFVMKLAEIQPSQLYISSEKLNQVMKGFNPSNPESLEPIPVKKLGNQIVFADGHTRAFAAFLCNLSEVRVFWDEDELDWEAYAICVEWCREERIHTIADLKDKVVGPRKYEMLWRRRCKEMQRDLEKRREQE